jgi:hypothetical protein
MLFIRLHGQGFVVTEMFWGLWLFPLGLLVYRSRFLPRFLGVWLGAPESCGHPVAPLSGQGGYLLSARDHWRDCVHAVAAHQGRHAASAGRRSYSGTAGNRSACEMSKSSVNVSSIRG